MASAIIATAVEQLVASDPTISLGFADPDAAHSNKGSWDQCYTGSINGKKGAHTFTC